MAVAACGRIGDTINPSLANVSDLHGGSSIALFPPGFVNEDENAIGQNREQKWIWDCWLDFCSKIPKKSWGVVNGEVIQGTNTKDARLISYKEADQIAIGVQILAPFIERCSEVWMTFGTEWHEFSGGKLASAVWQAVNSEFPNRTHKPEYELWMPWNGKKIHYTHHRTGSSAPSSKSTPLNRSLIDMLVEAPVRDGVYPDIVVRSHTHDPGVLHTQWGWSIGLASWQLKGAFAWKKVPSVTPVIGGCILELDQRKEVHPWEIVYQYGKPKMLRPSTK